MPTKRLLRQNLDYAHEAKARVELFSGEDAIESHPGFRRPATASPRSSSATAIKPDGPAACAQIRWSA